MAVWQAAWQHWCSCVSAGVGGVRFLLCNSSGAVVQLQQSWKKQWDGHSRSPYSNLDSISFITILYTQGRC